MLATALLVACTATAHCQTMSISIPSLHLGSKERVGGFEMHISSGCIASVPKVPIGWSISIDNDPSWRTTISGSLAVGAAALDSRFFQNFLVIEKNESLGGLPFDVQGEIAVTADYITERRTKIGIKDLVLKRVVNSPGVPASKKDSSN
jgi:hypothetical protein